jgi:hypothetical protein
MEKIPSFNEPQKAAIGNHRRHESGLGEAERTSEKTGILATAFLP